MRRSSGRFTLVFAVIVVAVVVRLVAFRRASTKTTPPQAEQLSIHGIKLLMTRAQVVALLGEPLSEKPEEFSLDPFTVARYGDKRFGDPEITYDQKGRVLKVTGKTLEWGDGKLTPGYGESDVIEIFGQPARSTNASMEPWRPGWLFYPELDLVVSVERQSFFGSTWFYQAELEVPIMFPLRSYWSQAKVDNNLTISARLNQGSNREHLSVSEVVGCYNCLAMPIKVTEYTPVGEGLCPNCHWNCLIGGGTRAITPGFLSQVHDAWYSPYSSFANEPVPFWPTDRPAFEH